MHIEVQVALNFVISYLYNKLPRRRVNIFGEELEKALKDKFKGHWYPEKPFKGSAFRCLKTGDPVDPVLERAAKESGVPIQDVLENLPQELAVWVDPGEVSYRIGEKGAVKVLFSESADPQDETSADREVTKTFNPEAQCFRPIEAVGCSLSALSLSPKSMTPFSGNSTSSAVTQLITAGPVNSSNSQVMSNGIGGHLSSPSSASSPTPLNSNSYKGSPSPVPSFIPRSTAPLTFTTATFAQTKFGSTKLKTSSKRANRMSPTEFSNYIKQRAMQQQIHHHHHHPHHQSGPPQTSPTGRSLSPSQLAAAAAAAAAASAGQHSQASGAAGTTDPTAYFFQHGGPTYHTSGFPHRSMFESSSQFLAAADLYPPPTAASKFQPFAEHGALGQFAYPGSGGANSANGGAVQPPPGSSAASAAAAAAHQQDSGAKLALDGLNGGFGGLGSVGPYPAGQYQHLLVAN